jgi:hypothetical protein
MAAGTYTLPVSSLAGAGGTTTLEYPLGVSDLKTYCGSPFDQEEVSEVAFWVGVGARDNNPGDVPRAWDSYLGPDRVARATAFAQRMAALGAWVELEVVPDLGHQESAESRAHAAAFLKLVENRAIPPVLPEGPSME